ncbi:MAG: presenilin family intramembrane aspartyl protease [Candidatus Norongarragalinales archaeon]
MKLKKTHFLLLSSFFLALVAGLFIGANFISQQLSIVEDSGSVENVGFFFLYILFATALMLLVLHFYRGKRLFFLAEVLLEFSALQILFSIFIAELPATLLSLSLVLLRVFYSRLKQPLLFAATVVVGALLGSSFDLIPALALSFLLAAYDYFAVFKSKHMVTLAKELQKREAAFAIEFSSAPPSKAAGKRVEKTPARGESILLGTGDFVIPVMLCVSVLKLGVFAALATALGAFVGLSALLFVMQKTRGYYPALPPIVMFSTLFYVSTLLF